MTREKCYSHPTQEKTTSTQLTTASSSNLSRGSIGSSPPSSPGNVQMFMPSKAAVMIKPLLYIFKPGRSPSNSSICTENRGYIVLVVVCKWTNTVYSSPSYSKLDGSSSTAGMTSIDVIAFLWPKSLPMIVPICDR